jgi:L-asparaginase
LKLLTTGGTIATVTDPTTRQTRAARSGTELLGSLAADRDEALQDVSVECEDLALTPSWALSPDEMQRIALHARDEAGSGRYAGVVITHGTQTLEYTAFLTDLFHDSEIPVVFTGAMRHADAMDADGPANLQQAIGVASAEESRGRGVIVCFAGKSFPARGAWKWSRSDPDAFLTTTSSGRRQQRTFGGQIESRAAIIKAYPGAPGAAVVAEMERGVRGMVIEGFAGQGGLPRPMHDAVRRAARMMPVVLSSRAPSGVLSAAATGGTGEPLRDMGLISARALSTEKAWLLLMVALAEASGIEQVRTIFDEVASSEEEH